MSCYNNRTTIDCSVWIQINALPRDDKLLEEDGDEEYDLGEGDEEALLADYAEEHNDGLLEESEDVLDLEVRDDFDTEIQDSDYGAPDSTEPTYDLTPRHSTREREHVEEESPVQEFSTSQEDCQPSRSIPQDEEEEEDDDDEEGIRGRFRSERDSSGPVKANRQQYGNIPDSLDQVIPDESSNQMQGPPNTRPPPMAPSNVASPFGHPNMGSNMNIHSNIGPMGHGSGPNLNGGFGHLAQNGGGMSSGFNANMLEENLSYIRTNQDDQFSIQRVIYNTQHSDSNLQPNMPTKIHINPHFRGNVYPPNEGRTSWNNNESLQYNNNGPTGHELNYHHGPTPDWSQTPQNLNQNAQVNLVQHHNSFGGSPQQPVESFQSHGGHQKLLRQPPRQQSTQQMSQQHHFRNQIHSPPKRSLAESTSSSSSSPGVVPRKQVRLEPKQEKDIQGTKVEENLNEDEETREYRKKIEQQKKLREKFLQVKEERRRKAALEKQREIDPSTVSKQLTSAGNDRPVLSVQPCQQQTIPTIVNRNQDNCLFNSRNEQMRQSQQQLQNQPFSNVSSEASSSRPSRGRGVGAVRGRVAAVKARGGRGGQVAQIHERLGNTQTAAQTTQVTTQGSTSRLPQAQSVLSGSAGSAVSSSVPQRGGQVGRIVVMRGGHSQSNSGVQRSVKISQETGASVESSSMSSDVLSSAAKSVSVENLANSTNETQLRMMCNCIGRVESIKVDQARKRALIRFAATEAASAFVKRYQRKMIDLSLIKVSLVND
ncbi:RNA-binding protein 33-like isoform X5 [Thrips palmi]|uniref:RNA-binding protein 33-like isoform X5 n=1 Tax=Thrips palmi TaxID=161013 RepID=A0A6P9AAG4_THRPL|nr:RNA-binding protein 33-like isoform X5 [Thrips palmi]